MTDGKLRFYDKGKETFAVEDPYWGGVQSPETQLHIKEMTHEEMLSVAAQREAENKALEALDKLYDENGDALQQLSVIERQELINEALEELNAIVLGGQNTREFYLSISHIRNVLERLRDNT